MGFSMSHAVHGLQERRIDLRTREVSPYFVSVSLVQCCFVGVAFRTTRARRRFWPCERQLHKRRVSVPRASASSLILFANSCAEINTELSPRWTRISTFGEPAGAGAASLRSLLGNAQSPGSGLRSANRH